MWKGRLAWGSLAFGLFFVFTLLFGAVTSLQPAGAAVLVSDVNNTLQNTKTSINTATTAINTATQVSNDIRNLTTMSPEGLLSHYLGVSQELSDLVGVTQAYTGLMSASQTMNQTWDSSFKSVDSFFTGETSTFQQSLDTNQVTMLALERTYQDSMRLSKQLSNSQKSSKGLQDALNKVANATGAKEVAQAGAQVESLGVQEAIKANQQLSNLVSMEAVKGQSENQERAKVLSDNKAATESFTAATDKQITTIKNDTRNAAEMQGESAEYISFLKSRGLVK